MSVGNLNIASQNLSQHISACLNMLEPVRTYLNLTQSKDADVAKLNIANMQCLSGCNGETEVMYV